MLGLGSHTARCRCGAALNPTLDTNVVISHGAKEAEQHAIEAEHDHHRVSLQVAGALP